MTAVRTWRQAAALAVDLRLTRWHLSAARILYDVNGPESAEGFLRGCASNRPEQADLFAAGAP